MTDFLNFFLHIDQHLVSFVSQYGLWAYALLFLIIFCETGLVITPFLPGDSLLFAVGSLAAQTTQPLNIMVLLALLILASILGNQVNYLIGRYIGPRIFRQSDSRFLNRKHLERAHRFYEKNGAITIITARFLPIIRTFVPFVAGVSGMRHRQFALYNVLSAFLWIGLLLGCGYFFGSIPVIKNNFAIVVYGIIAVSLLPVFWALVSNRRV
ncbi:DedA family protein [Legionella sp. CNM-4043-24]|uniref:DedA family protein n=1 Tax=Legionella sp. CNM-4043-24 TaxID=3421646 RepID=UPI00403A99C0